MRRNVVNAKLSKELAKATELLEKQRRALEAAQAKDKISKKNDENEQDDENDENEQEKRERAAAKQAAKQAAVAKAAMGDSSSSNDSDGDSPVAAPRVSAVPDCFGEGRPRRHGSHARLVSSQRNWTCVVSV